MVLVVLCLLNYFIQKNMGGLDIKYTKVDHLN
jgi:hypothetical protein